MIKLLIAICVIFFVHWFCGVIYLIHPFKCLAWMYHDIMGWHMPDNSYFEDGCSVHSHCRICKKEVMQDSQGNWFTFD